MYSKVIVPLDGSEFSEQALPYAKLIAGRMSVPIELVESYNILPPAVRDRHTRYIVELMLAEARSHSEKYLSSVRQRLEEDGHTVSITTLQGAPTEAISAQASTDADSNEVRSYLSGVKDRLKAEHSLDVTIDHQQNENVAQAIIDKASHQSSLVVMSSHGQSGIRRLMLGSIADRVVRHSTGPVLVVR